MRAVRWIALTLWIGGAGYLWFRIHPLAPDAVIRPGSLAALICISSNGGLATCQNVPEDGDFTKKGPISWYDRRTGRLLKTVFSQNDCEIHSDFFADRPPIAHLILDDEQVAADLWSGRILTPLPTNVDVSYEVSPDGRYLAWMDPDNVYVLETATLKTVLKRPAVELLGFHGNEIIGIQVRETDGADGDRTRSVALHLPDGTIADTESPILKSHLLSSKGDLLLKRVDEFQAAVCDARTGAVLWQTQVPFPKRPDAIGWNMYRFNAAGDELLAVYADEQRRPRFARWNAKDGKVISPLPTKLGPLMELHGADFDAATGAITTRVTTMSSYDNYEGSIVSSDGRYVAQEYESEWEMMSWDLFMKLEELETSSPLFQRLQLSAMFNTITEFPLQAVFDATTGKRVGTVGRGHVRTPSDASWFVVQDQDSMRIYSAPFRVDWMSLVVWALVPPMGLAAATRLVRLGVSRWRRRGVVAGTPVAQQPVAPGNI